MVAWRDIKRNMRRTVHHTMTVPALYLAQRSSTPIPVNVRLHVKFGTADVAGIGEGFAQMLDQTPRIIFERSAVRTPRRDGIVSVAPGEAYKIGATRPPDDEYITAEVAQLSDAEAAGLPVPAGSS